MPTYEYHCQNCSNIFEAFQGIHDEPLTECPRCHGNVKRKIHGGTGVIFKGSGFYKTDNRSASSGKAASKSESNQASETSTEKKSQSSASPDAGAKSESKPTSSEGSSSTTKTA